MNAGRPGTVMVPEVTAVAADFVPRRAVGRVEPTLMARMGSVPVPSSHRPSHPDPDPSGLAVCQMSIDWKWLRLGLG